MLSSTSEKTRRLDSEVPNLLLPSVNQTSEVFLLMLILLCLDPLLLFLSQGLLLLSLCSEMICHISEVEASKPLFRVNGDLVSRRILFEDFAEIGKEILLESSVFGMVSVQHGSEESSNLFGLGREIDNFAW